MKRLLLFTTVAIMATAMLAISCEDEDEVVVKKENHGNGDDEDDGEDYNGNGDSKGRTLAVSEFDKTIFESFKESLGNNKIEHSNVIWNLAVQNSEKDWNLDTKVINATLENSFGANQWLIHFFGPYQGDSVSYKKTIESDFKTKIDYIKTDYTYGAIGSYNDNGTWKSTLILLVKENQ